MDDFKIDIKGLDEVQRMLEQLPDDVNEKIAQDLALKAGGIVKKELQAKAPEGDNDKKFKGKLANKVTVTKNGKGGALIGFKKSGFYVKFLELGTKVRQTLGKGKYRKGANRGTMTRKPFIAQAHQTAAPKVVEYLQINFLKLINQSIKKQLKKLSK